jgi:hypothetical protein
MKFFPNYNHRLIDDNKKNHSLKEDINRNAAHFRLPPFEASPNITGIFIFRCKK